MKRNLFIFLLFIAAVLIPVVLFAQNNSSESTDKETTIEELYLQNMEIRIINEQAVSMDRDMKLLALNNIDQLITDGVVSDGDEGTHYILDYLAKEGIGREVRENRRLVNNFPVVRRDSCRLLGKLGGKNSIKTLISILLTDNEPMVLSEAVYALGQIGLNENNESSNAIAYAVTNRNHKPSDNFAYASLLAFSKLAKSNNGIQDPSAFRAIILIAQGNYIKEVKFKANEVLNELLKY